MELVYLWVDSYKNIRNQGFNFSPRFECEFFPKYDKDGKLEKDCELKITPKEYVSIFPDNIRGTSRYWRTGAGRGSDPSATPGSPARGQPASRTAAGWCDGAVSLSAAEPGAGMLYKKTWHGFILLHCMHQKR